jgi:hypothetical protein
MDGTGERIPEEPSELAMGYSARIVALETPIDVPLGDLEKLTRWESHVLTRTARKNGYSFNHVPSAGMYWLSRP